MNNNEFIALEGFNRIYYATIRLQSDNPEIVLVNLRNGRVALFDDEEKASIYLWGLDGKEWLIFKRCREAETKFEVLECRRAMYEFGRTTKGTTDAESKEEPSRQDQAGSREAEAAEGASVEGAEQRRS